MTASNQPIPLRKIVKNAWSFYFHHARLLIGYSAWLFIPMAASIFLSLLTATQEAFDVIQAVNGIALLVLGAWVSIAIITVIPLIQRKQTIKPRLISRHAWQIVVPYLALSIVIQLLTGIGLVLFLLPGILLFVRLSFAQLLLTYQRIDPWEALKGSWQATKSTMWTLAKRLIAGVFAVGLPYGIAIAGVALGFATYRNIDLLTFLGESSLTLTEIVAFQTIDILFLPLLLTYWVFMYHDVVFRPEEAPKSPSSSEPTSAS